MLFLYHERNSVYEPYNPGHRGFRWNSRSNRQSCNSLTSRKGVPVRAFVHKVDERSVPLQEMGAEMFAGDLLNIQSVRKAMRGIEKVYFCYPVQEGLLEAAPILAEAAREEGGKFVFHFSLGASSDQSLSPWGRKMWLTALISSFTGFHVQYRQSPIVSQLGPIRGPQAGDSAPDADGVSWEGASPNRWYRIWGTDPRLQALLFVGNATHERMQAIQETAQHLVQQFGTVMQVWVVTRDLKSGALVDQDGQLHAHYRGEEEAAYLLRPDGYIGLVSRPINGSAICQYMQQVFVRALPSLT